MFIRRTQTRNTSTGESYYTHRLVESKRIGQKVKQVTLLNLGRHFAIPQDHWPTLCSRIDQLLSAQNSLFDIECTVTVEREAQRIANQLLVRQSESIPTGKSGEQGKGHIQDGSKGSITTQSEAVDQSHIQSLNVDSLDVIRPRTVGAEHVSLWAMNQIGFVEILEEVGFTGPQRMAAVGSVIGRMVDPGSELALHRWLGNRSALGELLDVDFEAMSLMQFYRVSDRLLQNQREIENRLFAQVQSLFGFSCTITLYDLTNTFFEGEGNGNPKAERGHSKEKRSDCPLLTLGLVLDGSGFVQRSQVFAGNVAESTTLEGMLKGLNAPSGALVVMDRGVATEANLTWLRDQGYRYLVVSRERDRQFRSEEESVSIETASDELVHIQKVVTSDGQEVRLYCHSERRQKKEEGISKRFAERFESELKKLSDGLSRPRTTKSIDKIWERIGRLKEKSRGMGQHYQIEVIPDDSGKKAKAILWEHKPVEGSQLTHPGVYCLRSNETDWDEEKLWHTYIMLTDVEAVIRSCKSELGLRPVFHQKEERSDGHLFITVLAYQFVQVIRRHLREKGILDSWSTLRKTLTQQIRVTTTFRRPDGHTFHVRKASRAELDQQRIYKALEIDMSPGGIKKMIV